MPFSSEVSAVRLWVLMTVRVYDVKLDPLIPRPTEGRIIKTELHRSRHDRATRLHLARVAVL